MGIWYDVDPSGQAVYVTWITQEWDTQFNATRPMQVQLKMDSTGGVEYRYQTVIMSPTGNPGGNAPILVGWTPGNGAANPPITDLSASTGFITGDGSLPTALASSARPVTGTSINLNTSNIPTGSLLGGVVLGFGPIAAGVSLAPFGAPTCSVYMLNQGPTLVFFTPTTAPVSTPLAIPANPTLAGMTIIAQSLLLCPGVNPLGVLTSNGVCLGIGSF